MMLILALLLGVLQRSNVPPTGTSATDAAAREVTMRYRDAWLANDAARVMATLTPDAVLLPSGLAPIAGTEAIKRFWFPAGGPATTVTAMEQTIDIAEGGGDIAVVRGRGTLTFTVAGSNPSPTTLTSTFINVLRRQPDGRWLIAVRMWSDLRR